MFPFVNHKIAEYADEELTKDTGITKQNRTFRERERRICNFIKRFCQIQAITQAQNVLSLFSVVDFENSSITNMILCFAGNKQP